MRVYGRPGHFPPNSYMGSDALTGRGELRPDERVIDMERWYDGLTDGALAVGEDTVAAMANLLGYGPEDGEMLRVMQDTLRTVVAERNAIREQHEALCNALRPVVADWFATGKEGDMPLRAKLIKDGSVVFEGPILDQPPQSSVLIMGRSGVDVYSKGANTDVNNEFQTLTYIFSHNIPNTPAVPVGSTEPTERAEVTGEPAAAEEEEEGPPLANYTKEELVEYGAELDPPVELKMSMSKSEMLDALAEAET